jgi:hypothetical protein
MPKRLEDDELEDDELEWESRKDYILALYLHQDKPLNKVMQAMADRGFDRT